jgi:murein L,D-transpeptidase YafK
MFSAIAMLLASSVSHAGDTLIVARPLATPTVLHTPVIRVHSTILADSIVVEKAKRTLTLYADGFPVRTYAIALGKQPTGDKVRLGDNRTPEGVFYIDYKNTQSKYHMSLHISYPDEAHLRRASALGVSPGSNIMIHGLPPAFADIGSTHADYNWTEGCIAVTDKEIEEIWRAVPTGSPIQIKP